MKEDVAQSLQTDLTTCSLLFFVSKKRDCRVINQYLCLSLPCGLAPSLAVLPDQRVKGVVHLHGGFACG